ncbi:hypothetical protein CQW23_26047 [Capsicum baccatum]|uniref:Glycoside hydrolase family 5 domain-containing protein n=1 Tax=Capsicum baccatum TaxID=33114 RepID=A0A2G2VMQ5_CAPBA|nr:hypothetical protein CQW23_26047 [Capsicum baccatum]
MQKGAEAVHAANSDVLIILYGLSFDKDLSFLHKRPTNLTFSGKLVFEIHRYGFKDGGTWSADNANQACGEVLNEMMSKGAPVLEQGYPLFELEFSAKDLESSAHHSKDHDIRRLIHKVILHPMAGLCVQGTSLLQPLDLGPCSEAEAWSYAPANTFES